MNRNFWFAHLVRTRNRSVMATRGSRTFSKDSGRHLGSDIYKIGLGLPTNPISFSSPSFRRAVDRSDRAHRRDHLRRDGARAGGVLSGHAGRPALRAVADDHQAAQSVGIPLNQIWLMVWAYRGWSRWLPA